MSFNPVGMSAAQLGLTGATSHKKHFVLTSTIGFDTPEVPPEEIKKATIDNNNASSIVGQNPKEIMAEARKIVEEGRQELKNIFLVKGKKPVRKEIPFMKKDVNANANNSIEGGASLDLQSPVYKRSDDETVISAFSHVFHQSIRNSEDHSSWDNVVNAVHVVEEPDEYYDRLENANLKWAPPPVPVGMMNFSASDGNLAFKAALGIAAWELVFMYQRSLLGPTIQTFLSQIPLAAFLKPLQIMALPQNDQYQTAERHRILEITQIQYNYTGLAQFGGYFGEPLLGGPAMFNHVPPSGNLFLMSDADSLQVQLGYDITFIRNATVSKLNASLGGFYTKGTFTSLQDYADVVKFFDVTPPIITNNKNNLSNWLNDIEFGRQRLQGLNPEMLQKVTPLVWKTNLQPFLTWTKDVEARVTQLLGGITISAAIDKGIVYYVDYAVMDDDTLRTLAMGLNRYIAAPVGLFFYDNTTNHLLPLGIQLFKNKLNVPQQTLYQFHLPTQVQGVDTPAWLLAKIWLNSLDGQYQEIVSHLMETHQISELFTVAFFRNLALNHPVNQLLRSHFEATLEINSIAYGDLLSYDGAINAAIGSGSIGGALIIAKLWQNWGFYEKSFKQSLINRGFLNGNGTSPDHIQGYYWRDDGLKLYNLIYGFVQSVLDNYYKSDSDVVNDWEIQNWLSELQSRRGGQLKNVTPTGNMTTKVDLYTLCTNIVFTVTAKHSAGNSGQFDYYGFIPNVPGALYTPPRINERNTTWDTIFQALPPKEPTLSQISITYLLSQVQQKSMPLIGQAVYPAAWKNQVTQFQKNLTELSKAIEDREKGKPYPYLYLDPAQVANSIYI